MKIVIGLTICEFASDNCAYDIVVNLPKFNKTADGVENPVDVWLYVLKHAHEGDPLPDFGNGIVNEALKRIKIENLDKTT